MPTVIIAGSFYPVYKAYYLVEVQLWIEALPVPDSWCCLSGYHRWPGIFFRVDAGGSPWTNHFAVGWHSILNSYLYFGVLYALVLLYRLARSNGGDLVPAFR